MTATAPPDSEHRGLIDRLPATPRAFALLARFDRPIGWWLLFWPGAWAVALAGGAFARWEVLVWLLVGSIAMRGAGCVYNDIVDRDLDRQVARTASRPLAAGTISIKAAWAWLTFLCLIGLAVLVQFSPDAAMMALISLIPVAAYPFMKRITWWPQAWLGIVFSWGALVGTIETVSPLAAWGFAPGLLAMKVIPGLLLYAGSVAWVIGYDTIYALQDVEDDALVGVHSSALLMGDSVRFGVAIFYTLAVALWAAALWQVRAEPLAIVPLLPVALQLGWQVATLNPANGPDALAKFRSNRTAGLLMFAACFVVGTTA